MSFGSIHKHNRSLVHATDLSFAVRKPWMSSNLATREDPTSSWTSQHGLLVFIDIADVYFLLWVTGKVRLHKYCCLSHKLRSLTGRLISRPDFGLEVLCKDFHVPDPARYATHGLFSNDGAYSYSISLIKNSVVKREIARRRAEINYRSPYIANPTVWYHVRLL